ncbi:helix-turn-helix transcriptional regulator [Paenibacillus tyrfis]|uniref:LuxR C-terminal-related transcriptional regulator n=1 Tax=Paenibacillus tyrfis TaxID=1501230 RepID=UPI00249196B5|nr:LuxR C-terminal-related transcriptional regulator [Paenibacillus tyrfis]GLI10321.1 helix-turn-helix transcriptional regulator [Paenibacillus tyrfis]
MISNQRLLTARLRPPSPRRNFVPRAALDAKLERLTEAKVTLIQGAAGSGKTSLLSAFLNKRPELPARWISLNADNNEVELFWYYVLEALKPDLGEAGESLLTLFVSKPHGQDIESFLVLLVNQLESRGGTLVLVLDDFEVIDSTGVLASVQFFLRYAPQSFHLVLLSRSAPWMYLGDLRMAGECLDIGEEELRFSPEETKRFLQMTLQMTVAEGDAERLHRVTEGWIGGLQLTALALDANRQAAVGQVRAVNKYVVDYLSNEIVSGLKEQEKRFLLQTSNLRYFNADICDRLLGTGDSRAMLRQLADRHLFLVPIDEEEGIYRYHHMFGEFLQRLWLEEDGSNNAAWHARASAVYEDIGDVEEGIRHALLAGQTDEAIRMIGLLDTSVQVWGHLRELPIDALLEHRDLLFQRLFYHLCNLEMECCRDMMNHIRRISREDRLWSILSMARLFIEDDSTMSRSDPLDWIAEIDGMHVSDITKAIAYMTASMMCSFRDRHKEALTCLDQAIKLERKAHNPYIYFFTVTLKCQLLEKCGELIFAEQLYHEVFQMLDKHTIVAPLKVNALIGIAGIYLKTMRLNEAEQSLRQAEAELKIDYLSLDMAIVYNRMELELLRGDREAALQLLLRLEAMGIYESAHYVPAILSYTIKLDKIRTHALEAFEQEAERGDQAGTLRTEEQLVYAKALAHRGLREKALAQIDAVLAGARKQADYWTIVEAALLKLEIMGAAGRADKRQQLQLAREAIHYASSYGIKSLFVLEEPAVRPYAELLRQDQASSELSLTEKRFLQELFALWGPEASDSQCLTDREREVLEVLATGASNKEIGERLCISLATVKTHIINIYSKLGVSGRIEAVEKARQLGLR